MITEKKLKIFQKYRGSEDAYLFKNGDIPNKEFEVNDWIIIRELIGNIILLKSGKVSSELRKKIENYIKSNTENNLVVERLEITAIMEMKQF